MDEKLISTLGTLTPRNKQITCEYTSPCLQHSHTDWEISLFLEGKYINCINKKNYAAFTNRVFILGPMHEHSLTQVENKNRYRDLYIKKDAFEKVVKTFFDEGLLKRLESTENPVFFDLSPQAVSELQPRLKNLSSIGMLNFDYTVQRKIADSIIAYLLGKLIEKDYIEKQPFPDWFLQVFTQLQEPKIFCKHITEIIEITNYSHSHFNTLFKKYTKTSLIDFIGSIRLEYSLELLRDEKLSVLDIAYNIGYNSVSHYISKFKQKYGVTPLQYRKSLNA